MLGQVRQQIFVEGRLKELANNRRETDGTELHWVCCAGGFCDWGNYCTAPIFLGLGSLKVKIKHPDKYRQCVADLKAIKLTTGIGTHTTAVLFFNLLKNLLLACAYWTSIECPF